MALEPRKLWVETHQDEPNATSNSVNGPVAGTRRGSMHVAPMNKPMYGPAEVGKYFVATNPTAGTGIAGIAAADGTNPLENLISVYNTDTAAGGTRIYLDYLTLTLTAAGTNGTNLAWEANIDDGDRYTSGGTAITETCPNMAASATASVARHHFGALVSPAAVSARRVGSGVLRVVIGVVGDIYNFNFGGGGVAGAQGIINATAPVCMTIPVAPVVLGPGDSFLFETNAASQSGAISWEYQLGYWEV